MKKLILSTIFSLATIALFAQVKIGANPTLITASAKLQVEGSTGNKLTVMDNGNVGIGTVSPGGLLDVRANAASALARNIFRNDGATSRQDLQIGATGAGDLYLGVDASGGLFGTGAKAYIDNRTSGRMGFGSGGIEQISLLLDGNVGIGTKTPAAKLHVSGSGIWSTSALLLENTVSVRRYAIAVRPDYAKVLGFSDETSALLRMVIDTTGNVGIGTTAPTANLHVAGTTLATAWSTSSDARLKTNIAGLSQGTLNKVMQLQAVSYDKKETLESTKYNKKEIGFIAQDLQQVFPTLVQENGKDKLLSVNYSELIPVLTKAIQEQQAQIEALKKENAGLKVETAKVEVLESQMSALNAKMELFLKVAQPSSVMDAK